MGTRVKAACLVSALLALSATAANALPVTVTLGSAASFQNEGTTNVDVTGRLSSVNGVWAPNTTGTVIHNFYATGSSVKYFDGVSLGFDLEGVGFTNIATATLRFYAQMGYYDVLTEYKTSWHHYQVLPGAVNPVNQDANMEVANPAPTSFGDNLTSNQTVGWVEAAIDTSWITSNSFDLTLRLWNARIDGVELLVDTREDPAAPVPEPGTLLLLGAGLLGLGAKLSGKTKAA